MSSKQRYYETFEEEKHLKGKDGKNNIPEVYIKDKNDKEVIESDNEKDSIISENCYSLDFYDKEYILTNDQEFLRYYIPKKLDSLQFSCFHLIIVISLGISWILDGYEVSLLSVLSGVIKETLNLNDTDIGKTGSLYLLGCVIGSLFFGFLATKFGRKKLFNITLTIYTISISFTALAVNRYMFYLGRFSTGIAVGGEYSSIFAAIDELIPAYIRGRTDLIVDGTWHLGSLIASIISHFILIKNKNNEESVLRILFGIGAIFSIPIIVLRCFIPESPRWLIFNRKYKEALQICNYIASKCSRNAIKNNKSKHSSSMFIQNNISNNDELKKYKICKNKIDPMEILKYENYEKSLDYKNYPFKKSEKKFSYSDYSMHEIFFLLLKKNKLKFFYSFILMSSQAFFYNGIFYTYSLILLDFYEIEKEDVGLYVMPLSLASFLGPFVFGKFFDSWSRRRMIASTYIITGLLLIIANLNFLYVYFSFKIQQTLWFFTFLIASPAASSAHLTVSEIFPVEIRSQAMAIFFSLGLGVGGVFSPYLYGLIIDKQNKLSIFYSYFLAAFVMIFAGIFGYFFGIDSENKSLEEISGLEYQNLNKENAKEY